MGGGGGSSGKTRIGHLLVSVLKCCSLFLVFRVRGAKSGDEGPRFVRKAVLGIVKTAGQGIHREQ